MIILKTRSEVKVKVTGTWKWYVTLCHPMMQSHTKFGIPTSKNTRDMFRTEKFLKLGQRSRSRSQWPENDIWHSVILICIYTPNLEILSQRIYEYAPESMPFLETRSEVKVKVTVTQLWYATLPYLKRHPHTKFEIPTSNNIRDMLQTWLF